MKILVIDGNPRHRQAAERQLSDHNLKVVGSYDEAQEILNSKHDYEIVLTDLLMPPSLRQLAERRDFEGKELPVEIFLGLLAVKNGAKIAVVFSDKCHHKHPASTRFDVFNPNEDMPTALKVDNGLL